MQKDPEKDTLTEAERTLRQLLSRTEQPSDPPGYWQDLVFRTNRRIDRVSSGKSISISWAARVALPGALAILFFFIGLHYYVPENTAVPISVTDLADGIHGTARDSLLAYLLDHAEIPDSLWVGVLQPTEKEMQEYLAATGHTSTLLELLTEDESRELVNVLQKRIKTKTM
jgi:hypothetical protein